MKIHFGIIVLIGILVISCIATPMVNQTVNRNDIGILNYEGLNFYLLNRLRNLTIECLETDGVGKDIVSSVISLENGADPSNFFIDGNGRNIITVGDIVKVLPKSLNRGKIDLKFVLCPNSSGEIVLAKFIRSNTNITESEEAEMMNGLFNYKYEIKSDQKCLECGIFTVKLDLN